MEIKIRINLKDAKHLASPNCYRWECESATTILKKVQAAIIRKFRVNKQENKKGYGRSYGYPKQRSRR